MAPAWKKGPSDGCVYGFCPDCGADWPAYLSECDKPWDQCGFLEATADEIQRRQNKPVAPPLNREWRQGFLY